MAGPAKTDVLVVGRYAIHGEIASGGMATVHYGRLAGPVGFSRTVAIKRLHPYFARDPEFVAMFLDEARLAARILHPNVVSTLDVVNEEGELFLVMDYVQGEALSRLVRVIGERESVIPVRVAASILAGALHGLHAAHEARDERGVALGIVHRDVSPQNILVGVDGVSRVLDFGVAKAVGRLQTTREGQLKGKLAYMAPEQLRGGTIDRLTDVYSAGVVLWETLTTKRLFEAESEGHLLSKVLEGNIVAPSRLRQDLMPEMDAIVMRATHRDPASRFPTAREMAVALERTIGAATATEVGEWVDSVAHDALARRAQRLAEIDSSAQTKSSAVTERPPSLRKERDPTRGQPAPVPREDTIASARERSVPPPPLRELAREPSVPPLQPLPLSSPPSIPAPPPTLSPPLEKTPVSSQSRLAQPSSGTSAAKRERRILVIDDSDVMLARIRRVLELEGHNVTATTRAVGNARHIPTCDLVVIDYHMPGIDGGTVIASLRAAAKRDHPCLFYLYTSDKSVQAKATKLGFDGVFTDKGDETALVRQVRAVFRMVQLRELRKP